MTPQQLEQILGLSVEERIQIVGAIWDSIADNPEAPPVTEAQRAELERRLAAHQRDPGATRAWPRVRDDLKRKK